MYRDRDIHPMAKDLQFKTRFAESCTSHDLKNYDIDRDFYAKKLENSEYVVTRA